MMNSKRIIDIINLSSCHRIFYTFFNAFNCCAMLVIILIECSLLQPVVSGINHNDFLAQLKVPQCRQDCLDKFSSDDLACLQKLDCSICDFPPYQFHSFPDAINLMCWNNCAPRSLSAVPPNPTIDSVATAAAPASAITKISDSSEVIELSVRSMIHDGTLTMADIVWYADDPEQHQCLVTWEVFGGGIMGNLLTDTHEAELSLWPDSKYHIQVTCKNKNTNKMSKSLPILIDTANAQMKTTTTTTTVRALPSKAKTHTNNNDENDKKNPETERSSSFNQPHSNHAHTEDATTENEQMTTTIRIQSTPSESSDNNHLSSDATEHHHHLTKYKQPEYNNKNNNNNNNNRRHQITTKPLYDAQQMSLHDERNRATEIHEPNGGKVNDVNLMHGIISSSPRDAAKIASSLPSAGVPKIRHTDIQTTLSVFCVTMVVVCLVICTIVSLRHRNRKSNKHCDKSNLISSNSSVSCSSTTSIDDCEMDFNSSTLCITQTTSIHV